MCQCHWPTAAQLYESTSEKGCNMRTNYQGDSKKRKGQILI